MKRSGIKPGKRSLERNSTFKPPAPKPAAKKAPKRRPAGQARANSRSGHAEWSAFVTGKPCAVCGDPAVQGHHVIYKQHLHREQLDHLAWDLRNCLPVCFRCHHRHHLSHRPIKRGELRLENLEFAREVGLWWLLRRTYFRTEGAA